MATYSNRRCGSIERDCNELDNCGIILDVPPKLCEILESAVEVYHTVPEKVLLAAVLEMSVRDLLYSKSPELIKASVNWILYEWRVKSKTPCFDFLYLTEQLDLSESQIKFLVDAARQAENDYEAKKQALQLDPIRINWPSRWRRVRYGSAYSYKKVSGL